MFASTHFPTHLRSTTRRRPPVWVVLAILAAFGCGGQRVVRLTPDVVRVYPPPPDTARIQFLLRFSSSEDIVGPPERSIWQKLVGANERTETKSILKPYGVAIHNGKIYVCDSRLPGIEVVDIRARTFEYLPTGGMAQLRTPINCAVDDEGLLYVADVGRDEVMVLNDSGTYLGAVGRDVVGRPGDVVVTGDRIWISSLSTRKVHVFDRVSRELLYSFPDAERGDPTALATPVNLAVGRDAVYVSDMLRAVVKTYSLDGEYRRNVGRRGTSLGQFGRPKGIAVDRDNNIYVVDAVFSNVQMFNEDGQLLMFFGGPYRSPGDMSLPAKVIVDYDNLEYFQEFVDPRFNLLAIIIVTNQFGPDRVSIYGRVEEKSAAPSPVR